MGGFAGINDGVSARRVIQVRGRDPRRGSRLLDLEILGFDQGRSNSWSASARDPGRGGSPSRDARSGREVRDESPGRRPPLGEAKQHAGIAPRIAVQLFKAAIGGDVILTASIPAARVLRRDRAAAGEDGHASGTQSRRIREWRAPEPAPYRPERPGPRTHPADPID